MATKFHPGTRQDREEVTIASRTRLWQKISTTKHGLLGLAAGRPPSCSVSDQRVGSGDCFVTSILSVQAASRAPPRGTSCPAVYLSKSDCFLRGVN